MVKWNFLQAGELQAGDTFVLNVNDPMDLWVRRTVTDVRGGVIYYDRNGEEAQLTRPQLEVIKVKR